jgi:hypothetical protein
LGRGASRFLTFIVVTFAWVVFRAEDTSVALQIWQGMLGWNGAPLPASILAEGSALAVRLEGTPFAPRELAQFGGVAQLLWTVALLVLACAGPNSQQLMRDFSPVLDSRAREEELDPRWTRLRWRPSVGWALVVAAATVVAVANLERSEEFLYFQF